MDPIFSPEASDTQRFGDWQTALVWLALAVVIVCGFFMIFGG